MEADCRVSPNVLTEMGFAVNESSLAASEKSGSVEQMTSIENAFGTKLVAPHSLSTLAKIEKLI
jgi:hypothetical protein